VSEALKSIGNSIGKSANYVHYAYEVVALSKQTVESILSKVEDKAIYHMSGRKGIFINADDVIDSLEERAYEMTKERNQALSEEEAREIARKMAVSTIRWEMVKQSPMKMIVFDKERVLKLEEGTAPYLLYTYARISNLLKKVARERAEVKIPAEINDYEKKLIKLLAYYPSVAKKAAESLNLSLLANYASDLATAFNLFYENVPVSRAEEDKRGYRIALVKAVKSVYENSLKILGLQLLERM